MSFDLEWLAKKSVYCLFLLFLWQGFLWFLGVGLASMIVLTGSNIVESRIGVIVGINTLIMPLVFLVYLILNKRLNKNKELEGKE